MNRWSNWLLKMAVFVDPRLKETNIIRGLDLQTGGMGNYTSQGYAASAAVYKCVSMIGTIAASVPLGVVEDTKEGEQWLTHHPFLDFLYKPNPTFPYKQFIKLWAANLLLGGCAPIWANKSQTGGGLLEMWPINPDQIQAKWSNTVYGEPEKFVWTTRGFVKNLSPEELLYCWFPDPKDPFNYVSPLKAASYAVDLGVEGLKWNLSVMLHGAKPPFWIGVNKDADFELTDKQAEALKNYFDREIAGSGNAGQRPIFKTPGLELHPFGWNASDLDWLKGLDKADQIIANVYGVPPELLGLQKTYENFQAARKALYEDAVLPLLDFFCEWLSEWPTAGLGDLESLKPRRDLLPILQEDQTALHTRVWGNVDRGICSRTEARAKLGYAKADDPMLDEFTVAPNVVPLDMVETSAGPGNLGTLPKGAGL